MRFRVSVVAVLVFASLLVSTHGVQAATVEYSAEETIPVPPESGFQGSGGGDGWAVALTPESVFNVHHHNSQLTVACRRQIDASQCWSAQTKTVTDGGGGSFGVWHPGLALNGGQLFVFAVRMSDGTGGVACIDTTVADEETNPFCGFTALTAPGESYYRQISNGVVVGSKFLAFNNGSSLAGSWNKVLCFELDSRSPCLLQPFGAGVTTGSSADTPTISAIANRLIIPTRVGQMYCFDPATTNSCGGVWPVAVSSGTGAPYPLLTSDGDHAGVCIPASANPCFGLTGLSTATPPGLAAAIGTTSYWNGPSLSIGPRVYVPNGSSNSVRCFDFAAVSECPNFPRALAGQSLTYTVNEDPQRPTCIWTNADNGSAQIQNFDAYSGLACGEGPIRVLARRIVVNSPECIPTTYKSLSILDPERHQYGSGYVSFEDAHGQPIPGIGDAQIDGAGSVDLAGLELNTASGLPQFLITLDDPVGDPGSVTVRLIWEGDSNPSCDPGGGDQRPIVMIHGIDWQGRASANCAADWDPLKDYLRANGYSDRSLVTVSYYDFDEHCDSSISDSAHPTIGQNYFTAEDAHGAGSAGHTAEAAIEHLGYHFAWWLYNTYSRRGVSADVIGHSMGGLITRFALGKVENGHPSFPPLLLVEDAVTLGSPHGGTRLDRLTHACGQRQCLQMKPGDGFLTSLEREAWNPQAQGGTDWTAIGSTHDNAVFPDRAVGSSSNRKDERYFGSCHKVWYLNVTGAPRIEHGDYMRSGTEAGSEANYTIYDEGDDCYAPLSNMKTNQPSPVAMIALAIGSGDR